MTKTGKRWPNQKTWTISPRAVCCLSNTTAIVEAWARFCSLRSIVQFVIFIRPKSDSYHVLSLLQFLCALFQTWLMRPWRVMIHATPPCLTSCCQFWQPCCWHWNKTKFTLLMPKQNPCCRCQMKTIAMLLTTEQNKILRGGHGVKKRIFFFINIFYQIQVRSLPCFISHSFRAFVEPFVEFCVNSYYMDFS